MALTQQLFDLEYGREILQSTMEILNEVGDTLQIPPWTEVLSAGHAAATDSFQALQSASYLLYLVGQPVVRLTAWILYWLSWAFYKFVLVEGIYNHGLSQTKELAVMYWNWQSSLTRKQLLYEAIAIVLVIALYSLYKFLERRQYHRRFLVWVDRKKRQIQKTYFDAVRRIARFSLLLATMTSHTLFMVCSGMVRFFLPGLVSAFANPKVISLFSFWCPLFLTVTTVFQYREETSETERSDQEGDRRLSRGWSSRWRKSTDGPNQRLEKSTSASRLMSNGPQSQSSKRNLHTTEASLENELRDWLRFWMVRASLEAVKDLLGWFTPSWVIAVALEWELLFYVWIYCLPLIQPETIAGQRLPEGRPLRVLCSVLGPYSQRLVDTVSGAVPEQFWRTQVVSYASQIAALMKLVRLLTQPTADWLLHMVEEGRGLFIPALTLMTPGMLTKYGVVYVQFVLPTAKSHSRQRNIDVTLLWLQYWVINAGVDAILSYFSSLLWFVPFSTHGIFCLWCYLSLPRTIKSWYGVLESELKLLGLLPGDHEGDFEGTKTALFLMWVWENLPKAKDSTDNNHVDTSLVEDENENENDDDGDKDSPTEDDQLSPLPKPRGMEESSFSPSPRVLVSVDTCTTTTTEDGEDDEEDEEPPPQVHENVTSIYDAPASEPKDPDGDVFDFSRNVEEKDDNDKDDDGDEKEEEDNNSDGDDSDVAVIDYEYQREEPTRSSSPPLSSASHPMMTRSARRRAEESQSQRRYRAIGVIRD